MNSNKKSHQQNVDNLELIIAMVTTFEPAYDPSEARLSIPNLKLVKTNGDAVLLHLKEAEIDCGFAVTARTTVFGGFDGFVTRVINAFRISDVPEQTIVQCESIVRKLRNKKASEDEAPAEKAEGDEHEEPGRHNKRRNGSFGTKIENFGKLIVLLKTQPAYKPNEKDLTVAALTKKHAALKLANSNCIRKDATAESLRRERYKVIYSAKNGLVDIALDSKLYVKSAYGATSTQYKSISGILFIRRN